MTLVNIERHERSIGKKERINAQDPVKGNIPNARDEL
jgi:hypothetical protein